MQLCRAADRTERIGLATGVLVPNLRHPMTNAAAIATLVEAPGATEIAYQPAGPGIPRALEAFAAMLLGRSMRACAWLGA